MITTDFLDDLAVQYEKCDFIKNDPIQFLHRYEDCAEIELAAFIASLLAYGRREMFIQKLDLIFDAIGGSPVEFVKNYNLKNTCLNGINYRFTKNVDIKQIFLILNSLYVENESLRTLFEYAWNSTHEIKSMLQIVVNYFYSKITLEVTNGFYHLLPNPEKGSALKRLNMFLRWLVREGEVDLGIWKFIPKSELIIPLDTHVARISRKLNLITSNSNNFKTALELTEKLKTFDKNDPTKYDFALFGYGVSHPI